MKIERLIVGQLQTNCYLVWDDETHESVIIDPGDDGDYIIRKIQDYQLKPKLILVTHGHFDHVLAVPELKLAYDIPFLMHRADLFLLKRSKETSKFFTGVETDPPLMPDKFLKDKELIKFGKEKKKPSSVKLEEGFIRGCATPDFRRELRPDLTSGLAAFEIKVIETPGHSPGGVSFYHVERDDNRVKRGSRGVVFDGDTLFFQGMGRTDFSYASEKDLIYSIKNKLFKLSDETLVYPGHGEETTIGVEKRFFNFEIPLFF